MKLNRLEAVSSLKGRRIFPSTNSVIFFQVYLSSDLCVVLRRWTRDITLNKHRNKYKMK